uniref:Putative salivary secreted protein n=1 Tax=Ornithodoros parkeri TaxID=140564 RepID=A6N9Q4_ORNPR|nr:putative salivary secreted protein [Ornithodoros parkeri]
MKLLMVGTLIALVTVVHMLGGGTQGAAVEEHMLEERSGSCYQTCPIQGCSAGCVCQPAGHGLRGWCVPKK